MNEQVKKLITNFDELPDKGLFINTTLYDHRDYSPQVMKETVHFSRRVKYNKIECDLVTINRPNTDDCYYLYKPTGVLLQHYERYRLLEALSDGDDISEIVSGEPVLIKQMGIAPTVGAGMFGGVPYGTLIQDHQSEWWRYVAGNNEDGLVLCKAYNPFEYITEVNPNLGIRRCLKRFKDFCVKQASAESYSRTVGFVMPRAPEQVEYAQMLGNFIMNEDEIGMSEWLDEKVNEYGEFIDKEDLKLDDVAMTILRSKAGERSDWDIFEGLCA